MNNEKQNNYDDIINLPHHVSKTRPHMTVSDRAAQFAPFAALTGHGAAIRETARLTDEKVNISDETKSELSEKLRYLNDNIDEMTVATFVYFVHDNQKLGGAYVSESGSLKKMDSYENTIILFSGTAIPIDNLYQIDGDMFDSENWE